MPNFGGINKNVWLHVTDKLHQTLPLFSSLGTTGVYIHADDIDIPSRSAIIAAESEVKNAVVGQHTFADFISTDAKQLKFVDIEKEMLDNVKAQALQKYGISIEFLGIKKLGLPESVTR